MINYSIVTGYDPIPADTSVTIYLDPIATLAIGTTSRVQLQILSSYVSSGSDQFVFYNSLQVSPAAPTAVISKAPAALTVVHSGSTTLGEASTYTFTFTTTTALTANQDYLIIQFPDFGYMLDDDYSNVQFSISTPGVACNGYIMPKRNVIYVKPTAALAAGQVVLAIQNLPNPSYALNGQLNYTVRTDVNRKIVDIFSTSLNYNSTVCALFADEKITYSSNYVKINENTYQVAFTILHTIPANGSVAVIFDQNLYNLRPSGPGCQLLDGFPSGATCSFELFSQQLVRVSMNGQEITPGTRVMLNILNVNNPIDSSRAPIITVQSYFDSAFGTLKTICAVNVTLIRFLPLPLVSCPVVINPIVDNAGQTTDYLFTLSCSSSIRNSTTLELIFPYDYRSSFSSDLSCSTNGNYMLQECSLIARTSTVDILVSKPDVQAPLVIRVRNVKNPALSGAYGPFSVNLLQYGVLYGQIGVMGSSPNVTITANEDLSNIPNTLALSIFPKNYGEKATYYFNLIGLNTTTVPEQVLINFDSTFSADLGPSIECGTFSPQDQFGESYAMNYENQSSVQALTCSVTDDHQLLLQLTPKINLRVNQPQNLFFYVKNIYNPNFNQDTRASSDHSFNFTFIANDTAVLTSQNRLSISFGQPPSLLKIASITTTVDNVLSPADYTLSFVNSNNLPISESGSIKDYELQVALPDGKYPDLSQTIVYSFPGNAAVEKGSSAFNYQNVLYFSALYPDFGRTGPFNLTISQMTNPAVESQCGPNANGLPIKFSTQYVSRPQGYVYGRTYSAMDQGNCLPLDKTRSAIKVIAPLYMRQGLVYNITLQVEEAASDLEITPVANFLVFNPRIVTFSGYLSKTAIVQVSISKYIAEGDYTIQWKKKETLDITRYLDIQDTPIVVIKETTSGTISPLPNINIENVKYVWTGEVPREVLVTLDQAPAEELVLKIDTKINDTKLLGSLDGTTTTRYPISLTFAAGESEKLFFIFANMGAQDNVMSFSLSGINSPAFDHYIPNTPIMIKSKSFY